MADKHSFRIRRSDGGYRASFGLGDEQVLHTDVHDDKVSLMDAIEAVKTHGPSAEVVDES